MKGVTVQGPAEGEAIVYLHGGAINRHQWIPQLRRLPDHVRAVAVDLPGHGDLTDERFTVDRSVEVVIDAIERHTSGTASLIGLSLGGYIALATAAAAPDRVNVMVLSGATIRYTWMASWTTKIGKWTLPITARKAISGFDAQLRETVGDEDAQVILDAGISMRGGLDAMGSLPGKDYARLAAEAGYQGPVTVANGERDKKNIKDVPRFLEWFPSATVVTIEDGGHAAVLKQPDAFAGIVSRALGLEQRR